MLEQHVGWRRRVQVNGIASVRQTRLGVKSPHWAFLKLFHFRLSLSLLPLSRKAHTNRRKLFTSIYLSLNPISWSPFVGVSKKTRTYYSIHLRYASRGTSEVVWGWRHLETHEISSSKAVSLPCRVQASSSTTFSSSAYPPSTSSQSLVY